MVRIGPQRHKKKKMCTYGRTNYKEEVTQRGQSKSKFLHDSEEFAELSITKQIKIHTNIHKNIHKYTQKYKQIYTKIYTNIHKNLHTYTQKIHKYTQKYKQIYTKLYTNIHKKMHKGSTSKQTDPAKRLTKLRKKTVILQMVHSLA